jgi:hypothetical protein
LIYIAFASVYVMPRPGRPELQTVLGSHYLVLYYRRGHVLVDGAQPFDIRRNPVGNYDIAAPLKLPVALPFIRPQD